jgi:hypothetical protein
VEGSFKLVAYDEEDDDEESISKNENLPFWAVPGK